MLRPSRISLFLLPLLAVAAGALGEDGPPPAPVRVVEAVSRDLASQIWVPGTVVSRSDARIAAEIAGQLTWAAEVGDVVRQGGLVARIDDSALQLQLRNDEATILRLEANLAYLQQQVERTRRLTDQQIVSANDLEQVVSQHTAAEQDLVAARVGRERTLYQLSRTRVTAPFSGKVVERLQQPGGYVSVGAPIARLVDVDRVEVRAQAPLSVEPFARQGMEVPIQNGGDDLLGRVSRVIRVGDERSRMFELRVEPAGSLIIGAPVRIGLPNSGARAVVAVPRDALVLRSESIYVFKVGDDGTAQRVAVRTGIGNGKLIEVIGDVAAGEKVVVRGAERLRPGQAVQITEG